MHTYGRSNSITKYEIVLRICTQKKETPQRLTVKQENNVYQNAFTNVFGNFVGRVYWNR